MSVPSAGRSAGLHEKSKPSSRNRSSSRGRQRVSSSVGATSVSSSGRSSSGESRSSVSRGRSASPADAERRTSAKSKSSDRRGDDNDTAFTRNSSRLIFKSEGSASKIANAAQTLVRIAEAPPEQHDEMVMARLQDCSATLDYHLKTDPKETEKRRQNLLELLEYIDGPLNISEVVMQELVVVLGRSIFRALQRRDRSPYDIIDLEDDVPFLDPNWILLEPTYEILLRIVCNKDVEPKVLVQLLSKNFIAKVIKLVDSDDARERDYVKTIVLRIYGKCMTLRSFIRKSVQHLCLKATFETEVPNGVGELLELLAPIINAIKPPLRDEHKELMLKVILPLHRVKTFSTFYAQLVSCMTPFLDKDPSLASEVVAALLRLWPVAAATKQVLFLGELEQMLGRMQPVEFKRMQDAVVRRMALCIRCEHFQVAERALDFWKNERLVRQINENRKVWFPPIVSALYKNSRDYWHGNVYARTFEVLRQCSQVDPEFFDHCSAKHRKKCEAEEEIEALRQKKWSVLRDMHNKKENKLLKKVGLKKTGRISVASSPETIVEPPSLTLPTSGGGRCTQETQASVFAGPPTICRSNLASVSVMTGSEVPLRENTEQCTRDEADSCAENEVNSAMGELKTEQDNDDSAALSCPATTKEASEYAPTITKHREVHPTSETKGNGTPKLLVQTCLRLVSGGMWADATPLHSKASKADRSKTIKSAGSWWSLTCNQTNAVDGMSSTENTGWSEHSECGPGSDFGAATTAPQDALSEDRVETTGLGSVTTTSEQIDAYASLAEEPFDAGTPPGERGSCQELNYGEELPLSNDRYGMRISWHWSTTPVDLDLQALVVNSAGDIIAGVYKNNPKALKGAMVQMAGLQGVGSWTSIWMTLSAIPQDVKLIVFVIAAPSRGHIRSAKDLNVHILRGLKQRDVALFNFKTSKANAGVIMTLTRSTPDGWCLRRVESFSDHGRHFIDILEPTLGHLVRKAMSIKSNSGHSFQVCPRLSLMVEQGTIIDLPQTPNVNRVFASLSCDVNAHSKQAFLLEMAAVPLNADGKSVAVVCSEHEEACGIRHSGTAIICSGVVLDIQAIPEDVVQIIVLGRATPTGATLMQAMNLSSYVMDSTGKELVRYSLDKSSGTNSLAMSRLWRDKDTARWSFQAIGLFCNADAWDVITQDLQQLLQRTPTELQSMCIGGGDVTPTNSRNVVAL